MASPKRPFLLVLAGVNGAGKSSLLGANLTGAGLDWFNPDAYARELLATQSGATANEAMAMAWDYGRELLETAIARGANHAFETTLGGNTITNLLMAAATTHDIHVLFCGLASPELHLHRVGVRVAHGGHPISDKKIHERWNDSRLHLIDLMPYLTMLQIFDNSAEVAAGQAIPPPVLVMEMVKGRVTYPDTGDAEALAATPAWARPMMQAALDLQLYSIGSSLL